MSQQFGGSASCGRVEEGIGEEEKMEVMARVVSEAAIAKGKTTEHQATALITVSVAMVIATVVMVTCTCETKTNVIKTFILVNCSCEVAISSSFDHLPFFSGKVEVLQSSIEETGRQIRPYKVGGDCGDSILSSMLPLNLISVILM